MTTRELQTRVKRNVHRTAGHRRVHRLRPFVCYDRSVSTPAQKTPVPAHWLSCAVYKKLWGRLGHENATLEANNSHGPFLTCKRSREAPTTPVKVGLLYFSNHQAKRIEKRAQTLLHLPLLAIPEVEMVKTRCI